MRRESTLATIHRVHGVLLARGWTLLEPVADDLDETGRPQHPRVAWTYPHSYGGVPYNHIQDVTPEPAACLFDVDSTSKINGIVLVDAGNHLGCPQHEQHVRHLDRDDTERLGTVLDALETRAQHLRAPELIHCRFFGPCSQSDTGRDSRHLTNS